MNTTLGELGRIIYYWIIQRLWMWDAVKTMNEEKVGEGK